MFSHQKLFVLLAVLSFNASATTISTSIKEAITVGQFAIGIGSSVELKTDDKKLQGLATFLGNTLLPDGSPSYQMYLKNKKIYFIEAENFARKNSKMQTVLNSYEQTGGTCSAYAINNFLQQTNLSGFKGTGELQKLVSSEEGRTHLLADAINEYYLESSHRYSIRGILNKYGKTFGFKCKTFQNENYDKIKKQVLEHISTGAPVVVSFNIGPNMVEAPFKLELYKQKNSELDNRLWVPRKTGERNSGGHTIIAVGSFTQAEKTYLVMIDSDWSEPRVWDMDAYLNDKKTALEEVEFTTCN